MNKKEDTGLFSDKKHLEQIQLLRTELIKGLDLEDADMVRVRLISDMLKPLCLYIAALKSNVRCKTKTKPESTTAAMRR